MIASIMIFLAQSYLDANEAAYEATEQTGGETSEAGEMVGVLFVGFMGLVFLAVIMRWFRKYTGEEEIQQRAQKLFEKWKVEYQYGQGASQSTHDTGASHTQSE